MKINNGLAKFQKRMRAIPKEVKRKTLVALEDAAETMAADMRRLAPIDDGDLQDSIVVTKGGQVPPSYSQGAGRKPIAENQVAVSAGNSKVRYAHLVEFGTAPHFNGGIFAGTQNPGTSAQPFFLPGYRLNRKKAATKVKRAMSKAIREAR